MKPYGSWWKRKEEMDLSELPCVPVRRHSAMGRSGRVCRSACPSHSPLELSRQQANCLFSSAQQIRSIRMWWGWAPFAPCSLLLVSPASLSLLIGAALALGLLHGKSREVPRLGNQLQICGSLLVFMVLHEQEHICPF